MALQYTVQSEGSYIVHGLSTDTKPSSPSDNSFFVEVDTGNIYTSSSSVWTLPTKQKTIKSVTDFPTPVSGVITLEDNVTYLINGTVDIGTNTITTGIKNTFIGFDKPNDILTGTTTGNLITMDNSSVNKSSLFFNTVTLKCPDGTLFNITSSTTRGVIVVDNVNISAVKNVGTLNNIVSLSIRNSSILSTVANGFVVTGANNYCLIRDNQFRLNVGTVFNFGTSTFLIIDINRNFVDEATTETFFSGTTGGANVTTAGHVTENIFSGAGAFVGTITPTDTNWTFSNNIGTTNSPGGTGDMLKTENLSGLANYTTARSNLGLGTLATQSGTFSGTSSGTNTGDQTISDATITTTDITTNNATTSKHGFMPKGTGSTATFYRSDMTQASPTASVSITQVEIDVGSTPVAEASVSVTDAGVSASSKILGGVAYLAPTGKDLDELEMDALDIKFEPLAGSMNVKIKGLEGYIADKFIIWYTFS